MPSHPTPAPRWRIAFLTDEHVSTTPDAGGAAQYTNRMSRALAALGHEVVVLARTGEPPRSFEQDGVQVAFVGDARPKALRLFGKLGRAHRLLRLPAVNQALATAAGLAQAFFARHAERPFDLVHSSNQSVTGFFIDKRVRHVARQSCARGLWTWADGGRRCPSDVRLDKQALAWLELWAMARCHRAFAPSAYVRDYFREVHRKEIGVVRPPAWLETQPGEVPFALPPRFLVHHGSLMSRKGSTWLAQALVRAWQIEPSLTMVWAGKEAEPGLLARCRALWGERATRVYVVGALPRPALYAVLSAADAAVLPSRVDNLPNTAIESLLLGLPIIGTAGASIDELVEPGKNGALVPLGDVAALAEALVLVWQRRVSWLGQGFRPPKILGEMAPKRAAARLLAFAGLY